MEEISLTVRPTPMLPWTGLERPARRRTVIVPARIKKTEYLPLFVRKMQAQNMGPAVIEAFRHYYAKVRGGADGLIPESKIERIHPAELLQADLLSEFAAAGKKALSKTVMIVLNGGLGTSMGLDSAKSLIPVKGGASFLEITLNQALHQGVGLCFMNSFSTCKATTDFIAAYRFPRPITHFIQNKFPKILRKSLAPARWRKDPNLEWNPPGHGDIYTAVYTSGTLHRLLSAGIRYAFVSNSDNLGATLDEALLGYFVESGTPFMMEVSRRGPSDIKGGHLARRKDGRLVLREISQCPQTDFSRFQDTAHHCFFNTNNIWIDLEELDKRFKKGGPVHLPLILNPKTLDPKDESSPPVYQIETAMGSAVSLFDEARAVAVARERFLPVKTCNDLLVVRSDRFLLSPESRLMPNPENGHDTIRVQLDPKFYGRLDSFERRFPFGPPSLSGCSSLVVEGDVRFGRGVVLQGEVTIRNRRKGQAAVAAGTKVDRELVFD